MNRDPDHATDAAIEGAASDWIVRRDAGFTVREAEAFSAWLAASPRHAAAFARIERTWTWLDRPRTGGRAHEMAAALRTRASVRRRRRAGLAVAALFALVATGAFWRQPRTRDEVGPPPTAVVLEPRRQTLPDGTRVELKTGATITVDFSGPFRRIALHGGEALFHVVRDPDRPFVVSAGRVDVRAVGTAFSVHRGAAGVEVVVTEGRVAVEPPPVAPARVTAPAPPPPSPAFSALVAAGERINVDLAPGATPPQPVAISPEEIAQRLAWRATRIEFSDTPLAEAVALMNRHATLQLVIADPAVAGLRVSGLFRADNTETLVRLLEASFDLETERSGDTIALRRAR